MREAYKAMAFSVIDEDEGKRIANTANAGIGKEILTLGRLGGKDRTGTESFTNIFKLQ